MSHPTIPDWQWDAAVKHAAALACLKLDAAEHSRIQMATDILLQDMLRFTPEGLCEV
jgi:hypothetical protein